MAGADPVMQNDHHKIAERLAEADCDHYWQTGEFTIIEEHARKDAEVIVLAKQGYSENSITQKK